MSIICTSSCVPYITSGSTTRAAVESYTCVDNASKCSNTVSPSAYPVAVTRDNVDLSVYHVSIGPVGGINNLNYDVLLNNPVGMKVGNIPEGVSVSFPLGETGTQSCGTPNAAVTLATLVFENNSLFPSDQNPPNGNIPNSPFKAGDRYTINILSCCNSAVPSLQVIFERDLWVAQVVCSDINNPACSNIFGTCDNIKIPIVIINGQTTINGSDVGDMLFTIYDKYSYEKERPLPDDKNFCTVEYQKKNELIKTVLRVCSAKMVSVVRGVGKTLYCKVDYIWMATTPDVYLNTFYDLIIKYGMLKYILSRLLYGDFNINYLLGKHNEKFLTDLGNSRFCAFLQNFEDCQSDIYGFNKYFKKGKNGDDAHNHHNHHKDHKDHKNHKDHKDHKDHEHHEHHENKHKDHKNYEHHEKLEHHQKFEKLEYVKVDKKHHEHMNEKNEINQNNHEQVGVDKKKSKKKHHLYIDNIGLEDEKEKVHEKKPKEVKIPKKSKDQKEIEDDEKLDISFEENVSVENTD